jgi:serine/threonine protein kinase
MEVCWHLRYAFLCVASSLSNSSADSTPALRSGEIVADDSGRRYRVRTLLGTGGFGAAYQVTQVGRGLKFTGKLCLKVAAHPDAWHREAYFGRLLDGVRGAIAVHDSFATFRRSLRRPVPLYCLVTELAARGDLYDYLRVRQKPWSEARACREVATILRVLVHLHETGAVHRDLTPGNVLVTEDEHLKLGDFGIARHRLSRRSVLADTVNPALRRHPSRMVSLVHGARPTTFTGWDDSRVLLGADVDERPEGADIKRKLACGPVKRSPAAIGDRRKRTGPATIASPSSRNEQEGRRIRAPRSLAGKYCVHGSPVGDDATKPRSRSAARRVSASTSLTDIVVRGATAPMWKADAKGQKLLDVDLEREHGHQIVVIDERTFVRLVR